MHTPTRIRPTLAALGLAVVLVACSSGLQVPMQRNGTNVTVTIKDETGLVRDAVSGTSQEPHPLPAAPAVWNPDGSLTDVSVYWQSTACSEHPTLDLSGNALLLTIDLGSLSSGCDATLLPNIVTLRLKEVVDVTSLTVRMTTP